MSNRQGVWSLASHFQAIGDTNWLMPPGVPTSVSATAGNTEAAVAFTAPSFAGVPGTITGFKVTSSEGETATGSSSPITVTGLTNGTAHTFTVQAQNSTGFGGASSATSSVTPLNPIGLYNTDAAPSDIEKITIASTGNATDFGDMLSQRSHITALSSSTRAVFAGSGISPQDRIEFVTFASGGTATDFGDTTQGRFHSGGGGNSTRGIIAGGRDSGGNNYNIIDYVTFASAGDAQDFGDLTVAGHGIGSAANSTRLCLGGSSGRGNVIDYITTASAGNATDFGDLTRTTSKCAIGVCSSSTRGIFCGQSAVDIQYITISSTGNATDFGDLQGALSTGGQCSSPTRGVIIMGQDSGGTARNRIDYITIASAGRR